MPLYASPALDSGSVRGGGSARSNSPPCGASSRLGWTPPREPTSMISARLSTMRPHGDNPGWLSGGTSPPASSHGVFGGGGGGSLGCSLSGGDGGCTDSNVARNSAAWPLHGIGSSQGDCKTHEPGSFSSRGCGSGASGGTGIGLIVGPAPTTSPWARGAGGGCGAGGSGSWPRGAGVEGGGGSAHSMHGGGSTGGVPCGTSMPSTSTVFAPSVHTLQPPSTMAWSGPSSSTATVPAGGHLAHSAGGHKTPTSPPTPHTATTSASTAPAAAHGHPTAPAAAHGHPTAPAAAHGHQTHNGQPSHNEGSHGRSDSKSPPRAGFMAQAAHRFCSGHRGASPKAKPAQNQAAVPKAVVDAIERDLPKGPRVCILGGTTFQDPASETLVRALGKAFAERLAGHVVVITGGMAGVQKTFATTLGSSFPALVHLMPKGNASGFGVGKDHIAGATLSERMAIFGQLGDVYIAVEGGPGVANEATSAVHRGALVLPLMSTGGASAGMFGFPPSALQRPACATDQQWLRLREKGAPDAAAAAVVEIVKKYLEVHSGADAHHGEPKTGVRPQRLDVHHDAPSVHRPGTTTTSTTGSSGGRVHSVPPTKIAPPASSTGGGSGTAVNHSGSHSTSIRPGSVPHPQPPVGTVPTHHSDSDAGPWTEVAPVGVASTRWEEKVTIVEGSQQRLDRRVAELSGCYNGLSDELQAQIRRLELRDERFQEWRHKTEEDIRRRCGEVEQSMQKVSSSVQASLASTEEERMRDHQKVLRLEDEVADRNASYLADLGELRGEVSSMLARLEAIEEHRRGEELAASHLAWRGGAPTGTSSHLHGAAASGGGVGGGAGSVGRTATPADGTAEGSLAMALCEQRLVDTATKVERISQDAREVHMRLEEHEEKLRSLRTLLETREEHWRWLGDRVERGDFEGRLEELRRAAQEEVGRRMEQAGRLDLLTKRQDQQERAQVELLAAHEEFVKFNGCKEAATVAQEAAISFAEVQSEVERLHREMQSLRADVQEHGSGQAIGLATGTSSSHIQAPAGGTFAAARSSSQYETSPREVCAGPHTTGVPAAAAPPPTAASTVDLIATVDLLASLRHDHQQHLDVVADLRQQVDRLGSQMPTWDVQQQQQQQHLQEQQQMQQQLQLQQEKQQQQHQQELQMLEQKLGQQHRLELERQEQLEQRQQQLWDTIDGLNRSLIALSEEVGKISQLTGRQEEARSSVIPEHLAALRREHAEALDGLRQRLDRLAMQLPPREHEQQQQQHNHEQQLLWEAVDGINRSLASLTEECGGASKVAIRQEDLAKSLQTQREEIDSRHAGLEARCDALQRGLLDERTSLREEDVERRLQSQHETVVALRRDLNHRFDEMEQAIDRHQPAVHQGDVERLMAANAEENRSRHRELEMRCDQLQRHMDDIAEKKLTSHGDSLEARHRDIEHRLDKFQTMLGDRPSVRSEDVELKLIAHGDRLKVLHCDLEQRCEEAHRNLGNQIDRRFAAQEASLKAREQDLDLQLEEFRRLMHDSGASCERSIERKTAFVADKSMSLSHRDPLHTYDERLRNLVHRGHDKAGGIGDGSRTPLTERERHYEERQRRLGNSVPLRDELGNRMHATESLGLCREELERHFDERLLAQGECLDMLERRLGDSHASSHASLRAAPGRDFSERLAELHGGHRELRDALSALREATAATMSQGSPSTAGVRSPGSSNFRP